MTDYTKHLSKLGSLCQDSGQKWGKAFCQMQKKHGFPVNEYIMAGWFANAIEIAHNHRMTARADPWRPIDANTPEHNILLWNGEGVVESGRCDFDNQWWDAFNATDYEYGEPMQPQPTHWMPMPTPPKETEE